MQSLDSSAPTGSISLFFIQLFSTMAYSVLYVSLVLFAVQALHFKANEANHIMATFVAFNFALHFVGGFLGGRFISFRALFLIGMILQTIGCLLIAKLTIPFFMLGMAFFLVGSGMDLPCINCMITQLFHPEDKRREYAFLWNYSGMNIGFFIGVTMAGFYQSQQHFSDLFKITSISNIIALLLMLIFWKQFKDAEMTSTTESAPDWKKNLLAVACIAMLIVILQYILMHALFTSEIILALGITMLGVLITLTVNAKTQKEQKKLIAFCIFVCAALIFYTLYELIPMALTLFLERNVDRHIFGKIIPTAWFLNINTAIIIIGCPLMATLTKWLRKKGYTINMPFFFSIGLILIGCAIVILPIGIANANKAGFVGIAWPFITYALLAIAEILLSPIGYALVGELSPTHLRGTLMGAWLLTSGVSAILSNIFSNKALGPTHSISPLISNTSYSHVFLWMGTAGILSGLILFSCRSQLDRLMK